MRRPSTWISPLEGASSPAVSAAASTSPQPDGPSTATSSPSATSQAEVAQRRHRAEALADALELRRHSAPTPGEHPERIAGASTAMISTAGTSMIAATALAMPG